MENENINFVTVEFERYEQLLEAEIKLYALENAIFGTAEYNKWSPERLGLDESSVCNVLKAIEPREYSSTLNKLKTEYQNSLTKAEGSDDLSVFQ